MFCKHRVRVERPQEGERSKTGQPIPLPRKIIYENLKADIQEDRDKLLMLAAGQTDIDYRILFLRKKIGGKPVDIAIRDVVVDLATGVQYQVTEVHRYSICPHIKARMAGKVV